MTENRPTGIPLRELFPGVHDGWARFDGPAGTQALGSAIAAVGQWLTDGSNACGGGAFTASHATDQLVDDTRHLLGEMLGTESEGVLFGANMTTLTLSFTRAVAATLQPGQRIVGTCLDHEANIGPWRIAAETAGVEHHLVPFDTATGTLDPDEVIAEIDERTAWVTVPGASNLLGSEPDLRPIVAAAHNVGARVFVDAVALAPHRQIDIAALNCDALVCSPYKWYAPHSGVMCLRPALVEEIPAVRLRTAPDHGPARFETGMPNYEAIAGIRATARFLVDGGLQQIESHETALFPRLWDGLGAIAGVTRYGVQGYEGRTPTAAFRVRGVAPDDVCRHLANARIAAWSGHNYALEAVRQLGLVDTGGVVRAGLSAYVTDDDVDRLLAVIERIAR